MSVRWRPEPWERPLGTRPHGRGRIEPPTPFGRALRRWREAARMPQAVCAERAGYNHSYVTRLEAGDRHPTPEAVGRLARALGADAAVADELMMAAGYLPTGALDGRGWLGLAIVRRLGEALAALPDAEAARLSEAVGLLIAGALAGEAERTADAA